MKVITHGFLWSALFLLIVQAALATPPIKTVKPDGSPNRAAWMAQGGFGVMTHYLISPAGNTLAEKTADLNRTVNAFDVDQYVKQIEATGADWLIFTLGQGTGFLSSHNEYIDRLEPGYSPQRDLIPEIGRKLHERGKRLIIYFPGAYTAADPTVKRILGLGTDGYADRHNEFLRQYSLQMGKACDGWWFDSCGRQENAVWQKEMDACRAGNPDSVIAFSGAEFCASGGQLKPICPIEDYHAGEIHLLEDGKIRTDFVYPPGEGILISADSKLRKAGQEAKFYMPDAQFIDNVQWHCLLPIDLTFNPAVPNQYCHYTDKQLFRFTDDVKAVGGAITINVPIENDTGHIPQDTHAQLVRLGQHLKSKGTP
ncbi:MAG: hypothetical protein ACYC3X_13965 [Pirellulaceae bacterium]